MRYFILVTAVALGGLTGCFNGSDDQAAVTPPPAQPDAFVAEVQRQVSIPEATAELLEPVPDAQLVALVETSPETDEPIALAF